MRAFSNTHVNFTVETSGTNNGARVNMRSATRNWFIGTSQALNGDQFYIGEGDSLTAGQRMVISTGGQFGFGTINPHPNYRADFIGGVRTTDTASTQFVAETTGSTNSWARFYMRSVNPDSTINQGWLMGTSRDFNGNQFYLVDETFNQTRFTIQPGGGPIDHQGNVSQNHAGFGVPKAMVFINGDGSPIRCYNGVTGSSFGNCGFSVGRINASQGSYFIDFGFSAFFRFYSVAAQSFSTPVSTSFFVDSGFPNRLNVFVYDVNTGATTDRPVMIIMY